MESSEENEKIYSNNNDLLLDIKKELEQIIEYIQINLTTNKDINYDVKKDKKKVKLGVKRMKLAKLLFENEDIKNKNEINLNENEEKNENNKIVLKNKKLKAKLDRFKKHTNEIIKKVKDILRQINDNKNINLEEFKIKSNQEIKYDNGKYIGSTYHGLREGKGIIYYNSGNRYEGDWKKM